MDDELRALFAEEAGELLERLRADMLGLERGDAPESRLTSMGRDLHTLKGASLAVGLAAVTEQCHALEDLLLAVQDVTPAVLDRVHQALGVIEGASLGLAPTVEPAPTAASVSVRAVPVPTPPRAASVPEPAGAAPVQPSPAPPGRDRLRISADRLKAMHAVVGDLVIEVQGNDVGTELLVALSKRVRLLHKHSEAAVAQLGEVPAHVRAQLRDNAVELQSIRQTIDQAKRQQLEHARLLESHTDALDAALQGLRMEPLRAFLLRMESTVRQVARGASKSVAFAVLGQADVEVDRQVFGPLRDVLLHLLSNAVAHGIEAPEVRRAAGKPVEGQLTVTVLVQGAHVLLEVRDDGGGVDVSALRARAVAAGLWAPERPVEGEALIDLMSVFGVSTASKLSTVAGRGVGMAAACDGLRAVRGHLSMGETGPAGTMLVVEVPMAHSRRQGLVFRVGPHQLALSLDAVERVIRVQDSDRVHFDGSIGVRVGDAPIDLVDLRAVLGVPGQVAGREAFVLLASGQRVAVLVDVLEGEQPLVVRSLGPAFETCGLYMGGAMNPNGVVIGLLDPAGLMARIEAGHWPPPVSVKPAAVVAPRPSVLVADDSVTTRGLLRSVLEVAGYEVHTAVNGRDALEVLAAHPECVLAVSDVQMPQMNGLAFCRAVRAGDHPELPVILVTSLAGEAEVQQGMQAGADAYIVKGQFDQAQLLATVQRLIG